MNDCTESEYIPSLREMTLYPDRFTPAQRAAAERRMRELWARVREGLRQLCASLQRTLSEVLRRAYPFLSAIARMAGYRADPHGYDRMQLRLARQRARRST